MIPDFGGQGIDQSPVYQHIVDQHALALPREIRCHGPEHETVARLQTLVQGAQVVFEGSETFIDDLIVRLPFAHHRLADNYLAQRQT